MSGDRHIFEKCRVIIGRN